MFERYLAGYRYFALFESQRAMSDVGNAKDLYRSIGSHDEQSISATACGREAMACREPATGTPTRTIAR
ncbi:hypothetical protein [Amycolatopsis sp. NPDC052450]|uniref:hypothetical protein n=1 Tax=Amycolatopsis sp. NPDC052450 TaxID=3363937 RepID=UPI0037C8B873